MPFTEQEIEAAMPIGKPMTSRQIQDNLPTFVETRRIAQFIRPHIKSGMVTVQKGTNRADRFTRTRDAVIDKTDPAPTHEIRTYWSREGRVSLAREPW